MTTVYARRYTRRGEVIELIEESDGTVGLWNSHQRQKSTLELAIETLKVANLRLKLLGELGNPKEQKRELLSELIQAHDMVSVVIDEVNDRSV